MIFEWPLLLWASVLAPLLIVGFVMVRRRRLAAVQHYAQWAGPVAAPVSRWRRWVPLVLSFTGMIALFVAMARPIAVVPIASFRDRVILALDVSNSMEAADMAPTRFDAAKVAAKSFIDNQDSNTQIGIVAFAGAALPIQRPTYDREKLKEAIDRLELMEGTALGGAIQVALQTLYPKESFEIERPKEKDEGVALGDPKPPVAEGEKIVRDPGSEDAAAIIVLTDGAATAGPNPLEVAKLAAERGVRVFTVGVGTADGEVVKAKGISMRVKLDEETLRKIADVTLARYFLASTDTDLREIYENLNARLTTETKELEITAFVLAFAAGLIAIGVMLSLAWFDRIL
ncbi:MAG: VWA domain-containing protein [Alphaproteobacteria bacterium]|nr:VWA domain-containing protein [Alphaproteobacteria bacterium]